LTRFSVDGKYQADAGAIALFNTWKKELIMEIPNASRNEIGDGARPDVPVSEVNTSALETPATGPQTEGDNLTVDELFTKLVEDQDLGECVTQAEVAHALAEKDCDAFLKGAGAVDLTVTPTYAFDGFGPNGETLTKPIDADSTWQIWDYLNDNPNNEANDINSDGGIAISNINKATNAGKKHDSKHKLSRALQRWDDDKILALSEEDELSEVGGEARRPFSKGDVYRIEKFAGVYVNASHGLLVP
jgi:hypothetical protein